MRCSRKRACALALLLVWVLAAPTAWGQCCDGCLDIPRPQLRLVAETELVYGVNRQADGVVESGGRLTHVGLRPVLSTLKNKTDEQLLTDPPDFDLVAVDILTGSTVSTFSIPTQPLTMPFAVKAAESSSGRLAVVISLVLRGTEAEDAFEGYRLQIIDIAEAEGQLLGEIRYYLSFEPNAGLDHFGLVAIGDRIFLSALETRDKSYVLSTYALPSTEPRRVVLGEVTDDPRAEEDGRLWLFEWHDELRGLVRVGYGHFRNKKPTYYSVDVLQNRLLATAELSTRERQVQPFLASRDTMLRQRSYAGPLTESEAAALKDGDDEPLGVWADSYCCTAGFEFFHLDDLSPVQESVQGFRGGNFRAPPFVYRFHKKHFGQFYFARGTIVTVSPERLGSQYVATLPRELVIPDYNLGDGYELRKTTFVEIINNRPTAFVLASKGMTDFGERVPVIIVLDVIRGEIRALLEPGGADDPFLSGHYPEIWSVGTNEGEIVLVVAETASSGMAEMLMGARMVRAYQFSLDD
jgi:hypothetical protein